MLLYMAFQHDPIGLGSILEAYIKENQAALVSPFHRPSSLGQRAYRQFCIFRNRFLSGEKIRERGLKIFDRNLANSTKPVLAYIVPSDVGKMQSGGGKRIGGIAKALAVHYQVHVVTIVWHRTYIQQKVIAPDCYVLCIPMGAQMSAHMDEIASRPGSGLFALVDYYHLIPEFQAVMSIFSKYADVWAMASPFAWPVIEQNTKPATPLIYDAHDNYPLFMKVAFGCTDAELLARAEQLESAVMEACTVATFCTPGDMDTVQGRAPFHSDKTMLIPNGVDISESGWHAPADAVRARRQAGLLGPMALFIGAYHRPNLEAIDWILSELAPAFTNMNFVVAGVSLEAYLDQGGIVPGDNVVFTGPVEEEVKEAIYSLSEIALAPMKTGTGSSLKIPEYVAHGKIVVGTPIGLRGFEELQEFDSVLASDDIKGALGKVLERLEHDPESFTESCRRAREWVAAHLDWSVVAKPLVDAVNKSLAAR